MEHLRRERRVERQQIAVHEGEPLFRNVERDVLVFDINCGIDGCSEKGGEIVHPIDHGYANDEALEREMRALYSHTCPKHTTA